MKKPRFFSFLGSKTRINKFKFLACVLLLSLVAEISQTAMIPFGFWKKPATAAAGNTWTALTTTNAPEARSGHSSVWTGSKGVGWVWENGSIVKLNTGGQSVPATNTWTATSVGSNVPAVRINHTAVWADGATSKMIVWGGSDGAKNLSTGGLYDPVADAWSAAPKMNIVLPTLSDAHSTVWTGSKMIVWGDAFSGAGFIFDPATSSWVATSAVNAPEIRHSHAAVWTGSKMIVWGGYGYGATYDYVNTGGIYDPSSDTWATMSTTSAPVARYGHTAVWADGATSKMIVWGGRNAAGTRINTGGRYDPSTDTWTATTTSVAPTARDQHTAVWTGSVMIIWGGNPGSATSTGSRYDPSADSWSATQTSSVPPARYNHIALWTGSKMIVWGGESAAPLSTGGVYDPVGNSWTATSNTGVPLARTYTSAVWTGSKMIVWGGYDSSYVILNSGGVYDLAGNSWSATSTTSAPTARVGNSAVWTGTEMLIWGGVGEGGVLPYAGGRYNPTSNTWTDLLPDVPENRCSHHAVWTGR